MQVSPEGDAREKGLSLIKEGKLDDAIALLTHLSQAEPDDAQVHTYLGFAYSKKQEMLRAIAEFEKAARLEESAKSYYNLGQIYEQANRLEEAIRQYYAALEIQPDYPPANQAIERIRADYAAAHPPAEPAQPGAAQAGAQQGPPDFAAEQARKAEELRQHTRALRKSGVLYGLVCGAVMLPMVYFSLAVLFGLPEFALHGEGLYLWTALLCVMGAAFGVPVGLWVAHTCGGESEGMHAGIVLGIVFALILSAVGRSGVWLIVIKLVMYAIGFGLLGWLVGWLVGRSIGWD